MRFFIRIEGSFQESALEYLAAERIISLVII